MERCDDATEAYRSAILVEKRREKIKEIQEYLKKCSRKKEEQKQKAPVKDEATFKVDGYLAFLDEITQKEAEAEKNGVVYPPLGTAMRKIWVAHRVCCIRRPGLEMVSYERTAPGSNVYNIAGRKGTLHFLSCGLIEEHRTLSFNPLMNKNTLKPMLEYERVSYDAVPDRYTAQEAFEEYKKRVKTNGWGNCKDPKNNEANAKNSLSVTIRAAYFRAVITMADESKEDAAYSRGLAYFVKALDLVEMSLKEWGNVPIDVRGRTICETFLRGVKLQVGLFLRDQYLHWKPKNDNPRFLPAMPEGKILERGQQSA